MKQVTFSQPMAPHNVGETRLVPDAVAKKLDAAGAISASKPFGPPETAAPQHPRRPKPKIFRPAGPRDARIAK